MKSTIDEHLDIIYHAQEFGITSLKQLEVFLAACQHEGHCIEEIWGVEPTDSEYRQLMGILRKLMEAGYRYDGLGLLQWSATPIPGTKIKAIKLSGKGRKLKALIS
ncbi:MAG TPA: hypothetical protein VIC08_04985 [Cellvibrionaceae bacterium]